VTVKMTESEAEAILSQPTLTTHELAKALLALPETKIEHENHTELWSEELLEGVQVGLHRF
jgi:hypothetical protein